MEFQQALLDWYDLNKRDLVFRRDRDPYKIWISEIMSQQTRMETLIPYFERFVDRYPDLPSLAHSQEEELMRLWQGLGYYSRARNLRKAAIECMEAYDGRLPRTKKELMGLSGIGDYTAGAIASIAHNEPVSAIDGNVIRVFSRLFALDQDFSKTRNKKELDSRIRSLLPERAGDFNQALMELGALVCIPGSPHCTACPIAFACQARKEGTIDLYPLKKAKKERKVEKKILYIHISHDPFRIRLVQRENKGLLAGLYGFDEEPLYPAVRTAPLGKYRHIFTHREWDMDAVLVETDQPDESFLELEQVRSRSIPSAFQPFLERVLEYARETEKY